MTRTTGKTPWELFTTQDQSALKPLPQLPFEPSVWQQGIVHKDQHIVFDGSFYSVPHQYVEQVVWIRATQKIVQVFLDLQLIKMHVRATQKGQWVTERLDYPEGARLFLEQDEAYCLAKGLEIGHATDEFITRVLTPPSLTRRRKAQAVLRLADTFGAQRLENACRRAISFDTVEYKSLKNILEKGLDKLPLEEQSSQPMPIPVGAFLRKPTEFNAPTELVQ